MPSKESEPDQLDYRLLLDLAEYGRSTIQDTASRLGVTRGTVYARLKNLEDDTVILGYGPEVNLKSVGYSVSGFTTVSVNQERFENVIDALGEIPEILEAYAIAGDGDLLCRLVAVSNEHLMSIVTDILRIPGVDRTQTAVVLLELIRFRTRPLLKHLSQG